MVVAAHDEVRAVSLRPKRSAVVVPASRPPNRRVIWCLTCETVIEGGDRGLTCSTCHMSFHRNCIDPVPGDNEHPDAVFVCPDCSSGKTACFACGEPIASVESDGRRCPTRSCRRAHQCHKCAKFDVTSSMSCIPVQCCIRCPKAFHISCLPKSARRIDLGKSGHFFLCAEHEMRPNTKLRVAIVVLPEWALKLGQACLRLKRKEFTLPPWILTEADRLAAADLERRHLERKCKTLAPSTGVPRRKPAPKWTPEESQALLAAYRSHGRDLDALCSVVPNRTAGMIKNYLSNYRNLVKKRHPSEPGANELALKKRKLTPTSQAAQEINDSPGPSSPPQHSSRKYRQCCVCQKWVNVKSIAKHRRGHTPAEDVTQKNASTASTSSSGRSTRADALQSCVPPDATFSLTPPEGFVVTPFRYRTKNVYVGSNGPSLQRLEDAPQCTCNPGDSCADDSCINRVMQFECDPRCCPCGNACQNQRFRKRQYPKIQLIYTPDRGCGMMSTTSIAAGDLVVEYVGEVLNRDEYAKRMRESSEKSETNYYMFALSSNEIIDAKYVGNYARFINHSCNPNCRAQVWMSGGEQRAGIFAMNDIPPGTELTYDYRFQLHDAVLPDAENGTPCRCGSANCSKFLGMRPQRLVSEKKPRAKAMPKLVKDPLSLYSMSQIRRPAQLDTVLSWQLSRPDVFASAAAQLGVYLARNLDRVRVARQSQIADHVEAGRTDRQPSSSSSNDD
ncbi:unnamed protein product (mitochondrion) [Plasmodiophora brassicae]|uniref:Histone-lysine N-methyltransferase n=1 Tax=Plasmodiophora brassicae TaxID=37360 RepID=A0A0G4IK82_PLABS|nr:hypothetical protein PBRA_004256 [Plasmodiophora brassicae]SPR00404.1 unnamed protein product [Plasmodiophora brassicae]